MVRWQPATHCGLPQCSTGCPYPAAARAVCAGRIYHVGTDCRDTLDEPCCVFAVAGVASEPRLRRWVLAIGMPRRGPVAVSISLSVRKDIAHIEACLRALLAQTGLGRGAGWMGQPMRAGAAQCGPKPSGSALSTSTFARRHDWWLPRSPLPTNSLSTCCL